MEEERPPSWISAVTVTKNLAIPLWTYLATAQSTPQESRRCLKCRSQKQSYKSTTKDIQYSANLPRLNWITEYCNQSLQHTTDTHKILHKFRPALQIDYSGAAYSITPRSYQVRPPTYSIIGSTEHKHMQNILAQMQPNTQAQPKLINPEFAPPVHHSTQISNQSPLHNPTGVASYNFSSSSSLQICWATVKDFSLTCA